MLVSYCEMYLHSYILLVGFSLTNARSMSSDGRYIPNDRDFVKVNPASTSTSFATLDCRHIFDDNPCPQIQYEFDYTTGAQEDLRDSAKRAFEVAWLDYAESCFGHDSIDVSDNSCLDDYNGWGAAIFDALDTAIIMNLPDIVAQQLAFIAQANFTKSAFAPADINAFETTIRYLGGLLSAYDLLKSGDFDSVLYDNEHIEALLSQAVKLGDLLSRRFRTRTGLPAGVIDLYTGTLSLYGL